MKKVLSATVISVVMLFAIQQAAFRQAGSKRRTVSIALSPAYKMILPSASQNYIDSVIHDLIFSNLIGATYNGALFPELAERWEVSANGRQYSFTLRHHVRFHNGHPLTVQDVFFTLEKLIASEFPTYPEIHVIEGATNFIKGSSPRVSGLVRVNDYKFKINLNRPSPSLLPFLANENTAIIPADFAGKSPADFKNSPVGTGPFKFAGLEEKMLKHKKFMVLHLVRNSDFYAPAGNVDEIEIFMLNTPIDIGTRLLFDLFFLSANEIPEISAYPGFKIVNTPYNTVNCLVLNVNGNPILKNKHIRQLINYAINREELVQKIFYKQALPAHQMIPTGLLGYNPYYRIDYRKAAAIFKRVNPQGSRLNIQTVSNDNRLAVANFIRDELKKFNLQVTVSCVEDQLYYFNKLIFETPDSFIIGAIPDFPSPPAFLSQLIEITGLYNSTHYDFGSITSLLQTFPVQNIKKETETLALVNRMLEEESVYIPLFYHSQLLALREKVKKLIFKYSDVIDFSQLEVSDE